MDSVRPAAVAGAFYPDDPVQLDGDIADLLDGVASFDPPLRFPKALVVPHAGYIYSGAVAARAYDELAPGRGIVKRVILLGPTHQVAVRGLALPAALSFATPLGNVPVDQAALRLVADLPQVVASDAAHQFEHALEVQLPFLQKILGEFSVVPIAVGRASAQEVVQVLERLWGGRETVVLISTDLSHFHAYDEARRIDRSTITRIASLVPDISHEEACGATPLNGLIAFAGARKLSLRLLSACNSGDTAGGKAQVVGYSSFALYDGSNVALQDAGPVLLATARGAIEHRLGLRAAPPGTTEPAWLRHTAASFITLTRDGQLRGCIGSLAATRPLGVDVAENALAAAFLDPRFQQIEGKEWPQVSIEVSVLSRPKSIRFADEADLMAQIVPNEDGLILECEGRRGTFLPQVWESLPDKNQFMAELRRKAQLPPETRLARCKLMRYRVTKWKEGAARAA